MMRTVLTVLLVVAAGTARGADDDRARRAKVALALAAAHTATPAAVATAPPPRPAGKLAYGDGYRAATAEQVPLVVYVGIDLPKPAGAVASRAEGPFAGVTGPAVVVGYPRADRLWIDATLTGPRVTEADVQKAVDAARRKIDATPQPKAMPAAPKPLDWQIRGPQARPNCPT